LISIGNRVATDIFLVEEDRLHSSFSDNDSLRHHLGPEFAELSVFVSITVGLKSIELVSLHLRFKIIQVFESIDCSSVTEVRKSFVLRVSECLHSLR